MIDGMRCIVFDWDGTLMDSEAQIVHCLHGAIEDLGVAPMSDDTVRNIIGLGLREAIDALVPGRDAAFHDAFVEAYREHWFAHAGSQLFDGARDVLELLKAEGVLLAVATGKARRGLVRVLEETGLDGFFHASRCADETVSKPHPQMLLEVMAELAVTPAETIMVGDTEFDMEMATNAGTAKIAVQSGVHSAARLLQHGPLACLDGVADMPAWLRRRGVINS